MLGRSGTTGLGIHTELLPRGLRRPDRTRRGDRQGKTTHRHKAITTSVLGTQRLYDFVADNPGVEFWPVDYTNDPRVIGREPL